MKRFYTTFNVFLAVAMVMGLVSCSKDKTAAGPDIIFEADIDAYTVQFTNKTAGGSSYRWDFGDGTSSTEESPSHTYPGKGKYVPTLFVTTGNGKTYEGSTVIRIAKSSSVKLNDNSFSDWDTVTHNVRLSGAGGGSFRSMKLDYDANNIYFNITIAGTQADASIFDFYLDTDNKSTTGLITWVANGSGNDVLLEGTLLGGWFDMFYHTGAQNSFSFDYQSISDFFQVGTVQQVGSILNIEGSISRSKIKFLTGKGMKLAATLTKNDWSATLGIFPDPGTPSFYLDMSE